MREGLPYVHIGVRQGVNDVAADGQRGLSREPKARGRVPVRRVSAAQHTAVLDAHNTRQLVVRVRLPAQIALACKGVLGRAVKTRLGGLHIELDGLEAKRCVLVVNVAPEGLMSFLGRVSNHELVGLAFRAELRKNGIVSRGHLFSALKFLHRHANAY